MKISATKVLDYIFKNKFRKFPNKNDFRYIDGLLFPGIIPKFRIKPPCKVFTIGSCFARNIEEALADSNMDIDIPTMKIKVPKEEWPHRPNGILNEYTPGTIAQRILNAVGELQFTEETIVKVGDLYKDLLLLGGIRPVTFERAIERRKQIELCYKELLSSDLLIITLGYIESWFDLQTGLFLNQMPEPSLIKKEPNRYEFRRLSLYETVKLLEDSILKLRNVNNKINIVLTVSPVPIQTTFVPNKDCIIANTYSKSVLRCAAEILSNKYEFVDYFPSFEIVITAGLSAYQDDLVHVKDSVVRKIVNYFISNYIGD